MSNDWEYREPTQADCVPDKDGNYPIVEVWDDEKQTKRDCRLITVLPSRFNIRFIAECWVVPGNIHKWRHARIRKPYAERQAEWIERNGIKVGSRVRVTRAAESHEEGWNNTWEPLMTRAVDTVDEINYIEDCGIHLKEGYYFPYFVLEPVNDEYRKPTLEDVGQIIEVSWNGEHWYSHMMVGLHNETYYVKGVLHKVASPYPKARIKVE